LILHLFPHRFVLYPDLGLGFALPLEETLREGPLMCMVIQ
jgi:hypothetical protein